MKRRHIIEDYELSSDDDDVWEKHSFSFAGAIKPAKSPSSSNAPPPIESFAFSKTDVSKPQNHLENGEKNGNFVHIIDDSSEDEKVTAKQTFESLEDDDVDLEAAKNNAKKSRTSRLPNRSRRLVVDDDDDDDDDDKVEQVDSENDENLWEQQEENEVIMNALKKCGEISAELKNELYGTAGADCYSYSEVEENSSVRIVTQEDVNDACCSADSEFQPMLKAYQLVGVNFLLLLYRKKIGGAILADEMGLGKTIQAITYLTLLKHLEDDPGPHLIVCPASVLENWERELKKWCPSFTVLQFHGTARSIYAKELSSLSKTGMPPPFNVILVCYSLFERHSAQQKDDRKILKNWRWSCVLMDEAHALKDKNSYRWKNLMSVARKAKQRLMLTGTPLQNRLHELWSMLEFMMPDIFASGDVDLRKFLSVEDRALISQIKSILGPFILRRLKSDVMQQLVPKIQKVEFVAMGERQEDAYKEAIEKYRAAIQARMSKPSDIHLSNIAGSVPQRQISNYFVEFRKIANHPLLVRRIYTDDDVVQVAKILHPNGVFGFECALDRVIEELKSYNDFSIHRLLLFHDDSNAKRTLSDEHVMASAKCRALYELLPKLKLEGHRVLIFSQWTSMLDILEWTLDVIGVTYRRLDGSTNVGERQTIVDTFNKDSSIFVCLLSTRAGGQGLNLTGADTVIIHDMDFNPQIDRQAEDRCHRIGQTKPVTVYRMVTKDTVDENVYEIAQRKLTLDAAVLESGMDVNDGVVSDKTMGEILSSLLRG